MAVAVAPAGTAEVAETRWAAFPSAASAEHTVQEWSEQAEHHTVPAAAQEPGSLLQHRDTLSPESGGIEVAVVAGKSAAVAVGIPFAGGAGTAAGSLAGPGTVVPSSCCTFGTVRGLLVQGCKVGVARGRSGGGQDDTPLLSELSSSLT